MIIQEHATTYRFISQHDHGRISGLFAQKWRDPATGSIAHAKLIEATYLHDILWAPLDLLPRVTDAGPLDFIAFPEDEKLDAYAHGILAVSAVDPYMGLLHARHFSEFISRTRHPQFRTQMDAHIQALSKVLSAEQNAQMDEDLALLRLFDVFSLLVCMTGPHIARTPPPWLDPSPLLTSRQLDAFWPALDHFVIAPYCFAGTIDVAIPYRETPRHRDAGQLLEAFAAAPLQWQHITVRAPDEAEREARARARLSA